ncbi:unnamed protein product [Mytilus edulis]|uniref:Ankyrin repeat protein n=1 Tax=Mytilus edulis TaxID=6550 RepID=A0A8S3SQK1_MYTED|nr:unnamed protein product [Mytilus edulis]
MGTIEFLIDEEKRNCLQRNDDTNNLRQRHTINLDRFLTIACKYGDAYIVEYLLSKGADIHHQDKKMDTFDEGVQASRMGHFEIMQLLIEKNIDINQYDEAGDTPLIIACKNKYQNLAKLLIDNGADTGETFIWAFRNNDVYSTEFLIECGADVNKRDPIDWIPLTCACFIRQEHIKNNRCVLSKFDRIFIYSFQTALALTLP